MNPCAKSDKDMGVVIHWFRQDLRLGDNPALCAAARSGRVLPIYILDDVNAGSASMGAASRLWLHHSLVSLNRSLHGKLQCYYGDARLIIRDLVTRYAVDAVYWNRCYEPWRIKRDQRIKNDLNKRGIAVTSYATSLLREPWEILKNDQQPYKIFTPFYRSGYLKGFHPGKPLVAPKLQCINVVTGQNSIDNLALLTAHPWESSTLQHWCVGEAAASSKLAVFLETGLHRYKTGRDFPAHPENTSQLSPHLHFGEISPRQIWHVVAATIQDDHVSTFLSELGWREFSYYLMYHFPTLPQHNLQKKFDDFPWKYSVAKLQKWQAGMTGYPIVDAGMRQLWQTGTIHNRVRMIAGSFLVKNLLLHWRYGASWFWDCLFDADLASNSASWQWVAGCGTDAAPYFRVFNPVTQGKKFDADGAYTKYYVPELKNLPEKYLFSPWEAPQTVLASAGIQLGKDYPQPVVDLKASRERALAAYQAMKSQKSF